MFKESSTFGIFNTFINPEALMRNRKTHTSQSGISLVQVSESDEKGNDTRISYEVVEPDGNVAGLFGSLKEAEGFYALLCSLDAERTQTG
jgi:hypothetical protein